MLSIYDFSGKKSGTSKFSMKVGPYKFPMKILRIRETSESNPCNGLAQLTM